MRNELIDNWRIPIGRPVVSAGSCFSVSPLRNHLHQDRPRARRGSRDVLTFPLFPMIAGSPQTTAPIKNIRHRPDYLLHFERLETS